MQLTFDLISDLHVDTWDQPFDWEGQATAMLCVVAGDISRDRTVVQDTLTKLGERYKMVIYIDGNDEHRWTLNDLGQSYKSLVEETANIPNVTYLQDNVVIIDGVAFLGTNGWFSFDFDPDIDYDQTRLWFQDRYQVDRSVSDAIEAMSMQDFAYLARSVQRLQTHKDVRKIVLVTHTPPRVDLIQHDPEMANTYRINCSGNSYMSKVLEGDTENKITTWCFGHYHGDVDTTIDGVRYVNNCRGRGDTPWSKPVYYPRRIEITI